jgi:hypothetical protein
MPYGLGGLCLFQVSSLVFGYVDDTRVCSFAQLLQWSRTARMRDMHQTTSKSSFTQGNSSLPSGILYVKFQNSKSLVSR